MSLRYKVRIDSGTYAGNEGYVYAGDVSTTLKSNFTYSGKTFPSTLPAKKAYDVDWTIRSDYLKMDTIAGYIYSGSNYSTLRYSGTINGVNTTSRNLQGTSVDNGLRFDLLEPGNYRTVITATATNYYSVDGKSRSSSSVSGTPISFVFQAVGDSTPTTYTVSYNANGGTGAPSSQTKTHGVDLTLSSTKPSRANASAGGYTVYFSANGGSVSTTSKSAARITSYSFKNWNTAQNGSGTSYPSGGTYSANAGATLYAQWNSSTSTAAISLPTPTRDGYTFKGWSTSSTATSGVTGYYTPSGDVTLYAVWVASGTWGNLTWTLDHNGLLTIDGDSWGGPMADFTENSTQAWRALKNDIISVKSSKATSIGAYAFFDCRNLRTVECTFAHPTNIGANAFRNCVSLNSIAGVLDSVQSIGDYAFHYCSSLSSISIPSSTLSIGKGTFGYCNSLTNVAIANGLEQIGDNAFYSCQSLKYIRIPASVVNIGKGNFTYCLNLLTIVVDEASKNYSDLNGILFDKNQKTIIRCPAGFSGSYTIPAGVTSVGEEAFIYCRNLSRITMPLGLTSIGTNALFHCEGLSSVVIPSSVTNIGYSAFWACNDLKDVYFSGTQSNWNTISIGADNESLTNATIHYGGTWDNLTWTLDNNGLLTISGNGNMKDISVVDTEAWGPWREQITKVKINNGVTSIGAFAFYNCSKLSEITISSGVASIGRDAFSYCSSLTSVTLPNGLTNIGFYTFSYCNNLSSMTIPASVTSITACAFIGCGLTDVYYGGTQSQWNAINIGGSNDPLLNATIHYGLSGTWGNLIWELDNNGVLTISGSGTMDDFPALEEGQEETRAWRPYMNNIINVEIENGITSLGNAAFAYCEKMISISIPQSTAKITNAGLSSCSNLLNIYIDEENAEYSDLDGVLFNKNGKALIMFPAGRSGQYAIPSGVESIKGGAFLNCSNVTGITIPSSVSSLGQIAFYGCEGLQDLTILPGLTEIPFACFAYCSNLENVEIPSSVSIIGSNAFAACRNLEFIDIPMGVKTIDMGAFSSCSNLKSIAIPISVSAINQLAFSQCDSLTDVFYGGTQAEWEKIAIDPYVGDLTNATVHFKCIPDFVLPDALTEIGEEAFANCGFTYVKLPENTDTIGKNAFANCPNLKYIYIPKNCLWIDRYAFTGVTGLTILGVDGSYAQTYASGKGYDFIAVP